MVGGRCRALCQPLLVDVKLLLFPVQPSPGHSVAVFTSLSFFTGAADAADSFVPAGAQSCRAVRLWLQGRERPLTILNKNILNFIIRGEELSRCET